MKILVQLCLAMTLLTVYSDRSFADAEVTCECLESTCGKCETETGVDFYTEKCGPGKSRVKSCKRPQCKAVFDYEACLARNDESRPATRAVASQMTDRAGAEQAPPRSADVVLALGHGHIERGDAKLDISKGMKVFVGDRIITDEDGRVRIQFPELSEVFVSPMSNILIVDASVEKRAGLSKRNILLDLQRGRVRSRVQGRYGDGDSKFEIKTKSAVAGVRGTEFVVAFEQSGSKWMTAVFTKKGKVDLDGLFGDRRQNHAEVLADMKAAHIVVAPPAGASPAEIEAALARGHVTSSSKMSDADASEFDDERFAMGLSDARSANRRPAARDMTPLCRAPAGAFNQCSWTCEGNPTGAKKCRSDLPNVKCVRRLCRASGEWAEPTVLPVKDGVSCEGGSGPVVGDCGGYW